MRTTVDARADVYSLGCVLFEMLSGDPPHGRGSAISILRKQITGPVPSVCDLRPELPMALDKALATAMAREPAKRFDSAAASIGKTVLVLSFVNRSPDPESE